jgi:hypothetical protein
VDGLVYLFVKWVDLLSAILYRSRPDYVTSITSIKRRARSLITLAAVLLFVISIVAVGREKPER